MNTNQNLLSIKTVADFKRAIQIGVKVHCIFHMEFAGRNQTTGEVFYKDMDRGEREVTIRQTNSFALKTQKKDGTFQNSWCNYPKATDTVISDNRVTIFEEQREGQKIPILTYWISTGQAIETPAEEVKTEENAVLPLSSIVTRQLLMF